MSVDNGFRIAIASVGRFHMFDLAREMVRSGRHAVTLLTGYPRIKVDLDLRSVTRTRPRWVLTERLFARLRMGLPPWLPFVVMQDFGKWVARSLAHEGIDIFDALDGGGLEAGRMARDRGGVWICNRGSAHMLTQKLLLEEEHRRWRVPVPKHYFWPAHVDRCLAEYGGADAIVTPSSFAARSFVDQGLPPAKIHICPYGVDLTMFQPQPKLDGTFRILFVGTQSIQKGIGYLFEAVRPLVQCGSVEVWLIGSVAEDAREILHNNATLFCHKGVHAREQLSWFYSQASVLVLPSIQEGLALVQAQAMACGVPVIATTNTGAEDLFVDGREGFIVPIRDPLTIREKIEWMLDNPQRRDKMATAAIGRVRQLGGWSTYGSRVFRLYRFLLNKKRNSEPDAGEPVFPPRGATAFDG